MSVKAKVKNALAKPLVRHAIQTVLSVVIALYAPQIAVAIKTSEGAVKAAGAIIGAAVLAQSE